ncbi:TPA: gp436 family protein [Mannheimia haemolytica]
MYALVDDFVLRIGEQESIELTDREMVGVVDEATLEVALADSSSQIDGYLSGRYRLPLKTVPQNLKRICCDLARYHLTSKSLVTMTEEVENRYKLCLKELENISKGVVSLAVDETNEEESATGENTVQFFNGGNRIWGSDKR